MLNYFLCIVSPERLEKEVRSLLTPSMSFGVRVLPPPCGVDSAWHGAKLISNVSYCKMSLVFLYAEKCF